jgi:uridine monophosphate synthetase
MMTGSTFFDKLAAAAVRNDSWLCVGLDPVPAAVPPAYRHASNPILAWNQAVVAATADLVCAYKPNIAFYEALGDGLATLRATLATIPTNIPVILDAKRGDIGSTAMAYARALFDDLGADAVTLSPYLGHDSVAPFAAYADRGLFILCHTSNPGAADLQELIVDHGPPGGEPLYVQVARQAMTWSAHRNVGLVAGATYPAALAAVRAVAPHAWFLVPGVGPQGGDLAAAVAAALRADGQGVIINASRAITQAADPRAAAENLRAAIAYACQETLAHRQNAVPEAAAPVTPAVADLIAALFHLGAVRFGDFTLASGRPSPLYIDLRLLASDPPLLRQVATAYAALLHGMRYDRLAGVPYAALPIGTALSLRTGKPLLYPRKEAKAYGTGKSIEGLWLAGERVVVVEDLVTSGGSTLRSVELLRAAGLVVRDVAVLIDREQGARATLAGAGLALHAVCTLSQVLDVLLERGLIDAVRYAEVLAYLQSDDATT